MVSIHAPRARGDPPDKVAPQKWRVSIHAPRARGDRPRPGRRDMRKFQFTPLVRGATHPASDTGSSSRFNSRPSCEGRHKHLEPHSRRYVSIHAPRARGDWPYFLHIDAKCFNSRPSCEGRQSKSRVDALFRVSIHAPHARGDLMLTCRCVRARFQFTPLMRGATTPGVYKDPSGSFNSRPSCEGRRWIKGLLGR